MFRQLLVPVDLSERHGKAMKMAADLAVQHKGEVVLLHVIEPISGTAIDEEKVFYGRLEKTSWQHLEKLGKQLAKADVPWKAQVLYGNRGKSILATARKMKSDLIVMTAPQVDPNDVGTGLGSLSFKVSLFAHCPVLLVK